MCSVQDVLADVTTAMRIEYDSIRHIHTPRDHVVDYSRHRITIITVNLLVKGCNGIL